MCLGQRKPDPTTTMTKIFAIDAKSYDTDAESVKEDIDWALLLNEKKQYVPQHAASSFLTTSTSKCIREANRVL